MMDDHETPAVPAENPPAFTLTLPEAEAACFRAHIREGMTVLEYGSGGSTFEALRLGAGRVFSVESDRDWAKKIREELANEFSPDRFHVHHADIGATQAWGRPLDHSGFKTYHRYPHEIWDLDGFAQPDLILIDGRFRTACFVAAATRITAPVTLLFDDYGVRPEYHWVEEICPLSKMAGRMAVFELTPRTIPPQLMTRVAGSYADPR
ncbi:hypothetical protein [Paracoccus jeotgali]|uniref:hypothetical protein n=1 Tax=Paracoccus jeotgali TaxID=2065379 RepID=UPI0028B1AAB4|nr:hypothetical protein [Paracoccus jeotgali]